MQRDRSSRCTRGRDGGSRRLTCRQKEDSCLKERFSQACTCMA